MSVGEQISSSELLARVIWECLKEGSPVEIEGLGVFRLGECGEVDFAAQAPKPVVFLAYVRENYPAVERLYGQLCAAGLSPWLDKKKLLPGQNWPRAIDRAIKRSDYFIPCFSCRSVSRRGQFHSELRHALRCMAQMPLDDVFVIPARLDDCQIPLAIERELHHVDLFPDWDAGVRQIVETVRAHRMRRV
jgi:hypothetical protein